MNIKFSFVIVVEIKKCCCPVFILRHPTLVLWIGSDLLSSSRDGVLEGRSKRRWLFQVFLRKLPAKSLETWEYVFNVWGLNYLWCCGRSKWGQRKWKMKNTMKKKRGATGLCARNVDAATAGTGCSCAYTVIQGKALQCYLWECWSFIFSTYRVYFSHSSNSVKLTTIVTCT